ncbi:MAG: DUF86 domain-containing protein [Oceanospirillaceae bacterium]|nr:DUF86 domain-containing protein [Oceanospirillaceae bacterium]
MPVNDVLINKTATIIRCIKRINEEFAGDEQGFLVNYTKQDSVILNLQRACEASLDIANFLIKKNKLGIPQSARDSFDLLVEGNIINQNLALKLKKMIGLRNIAVHDYQKLNMAIVVAVVRYHLTDFDEYCAQILP